MNTKILVTYATMSGSTAEVAGAVANRLSRDGVAVDLLPVSQVTDLSAYDAAVMGAPMILGWHPEMVNFIEKNQQALEALPVACFTTQLHLTEVPETAVGDIPIFCDTQLAKPPANPKKMNFPEKLGTPASCVGPALEKAPRVKPISIGFFGGVLNYGKLKLLHWLFVKLIIRGVEGDYRHWNIIDEWVEIIRPQLAPAQ